MSAEAHEAGLTLAVVRSVEALAEWEGAWWDLAAAAPGATPFQTPGWLLAWARHLPSGELTALVVREGARLRGLAVFSLTAEGGARRLAWAGAGISDYLTVLVDPQRTSEVWEMLMRGLDRALSECDGARLDNVPDGDPLFERLDRLPRPWKWTRAKDAVCLVAELDQGNADPTAPRPRVAAKANAAVRRLARVGPVRFRHVGDAQGEDDPGAHAELLESFFRLHTDRWDGAGVMGAGEVRAHHREASEALRRRGALRLYGLEVAGELIGVVYSFVFRERLWLYLGGFSPAHARFSPGSILIEHARGAALAEGAALMDFLRGQEPYKYRWGVRERCTWRVEIARAG